MFVGRESELIKLEKMYSTNEFQFAVIYGRRRVGKTTLIREFLKNKESLLYVSLEWTQKETEKCRGLFPCKPRCQLRASASDHDRGNAEYICSSWCTWNVLYPWYPLYCYGVKPGMGSSYGGVFWK